MQLMHYSFKAKIYPTGINWCVDVPPKITGRMKPVRGYIRIKGTINAFHFKQTLVPVRGGPFRLFVNLLMMKGAATALGKMASFKIAQNFEKIEKQYPVPKQLSERLKQTGLTDDFKRLTATRQKDILRYLNNIKTRETLSRNVESLVGQLQRKESKVRIPQSAR